MKPTRAGLLLLLLAGCSVLDPVDPPRIAPPDSDRVVTLPESGDYRVEPAALTHLLRGLYFLRTERAEAAIPHLRLALLYAMDSAFVHERLAQAWQSLGHDDRAWEAIRSGLERLPDDPALNVVAGTWQLAARRFEAARKHLEHALAQDPDTLSALVPYLRTLLWLGRGDEAFRVAKGMLGRRAPRAVVSGAAEAFEEHGQTRRALRILDQGEAPQEPLVDLFERVRLLESVARPEEAYSVLATSAFPDDRLVLASMARLGQLAGKPVDGLWVRLGPQVDIDPGFHLWVAQTEFFYGDRDRGERMLRGHLARYPADAEPRLNLAELALSRHRAPECVRLLRPLEANMDGALLVARCHASVGRHREASVALRRAASLGLAPWALGFELGAIAVRRGSLPRALRYAERFLRPSTPAPETLAIARAAIYDHFGEGALAVDALLGMGDEALTLELRLLLHELQARHGQADVALAALEDLLRDSPNDPLRQNALGFVLADQAVRLQQAEVLLRRAWRAAPEDGFVSDSLGWLLFRRGKRKQAEHHLSIAHRLAPTDPEILVHLAQVQMAARKTDVAKKTIARALKALPSMEQKQLLERLLRKGGP